MDKSSAGAQNRRAHAAWVEQPNPPYAQGKNRIVLLAHVTSTPFEEAMFHAPFRPSDAPYDPRARRCQVCRCTGELGVRKPGNYRFFTASDDGAPGRSS